MMERLKELRGRGSDPTPGRQRGAFIFKALDKCAYDNQVTLAVSVAGMA